MTAILILCAFLAISATALAILRPLLPSVLILSAYSGILVVLLSLLGAVDVAFTEAVVGAGVSTVVLMALVRRLDNHESAPSSRSMHIAAFIGTLGVGIALFPALFALPAFGDPSAPAALYLAPEYIQRSYVETHTPNIVTAILADYRGFDTLIETAVIMTASVACVLVLGRRV